MERPLIAYVSFLSLINTTIVNLVLISSVKDIFKIFCHCSISLLLIEVPLAYVPVSKVIIVNNAFIPYDTNTTISDVHKNEIRINKTQRTLTIKLICKLTTTNSNYTFNIPNILNELFFANNWYGGVISFVGTVWVANPFALYFYRVSGTEWRCGVSAQASDKWICIQQTIKY